MSTNKSKSEIITFKVDAALSTAMEGLPNRSDFIRRALIAALESTCPLCCGTGVLTADQHRHWQTFAQSHTVEKCGHCQEIHIVCHQEKAPSTKAKKERRA